jgi:hypothetical protein
MTDRMSNDEFERLDKMLHDRPHQVRDAKHQKRRTRRAAK